MVEVDKQSLKSFKKIYIKKSKGYRLHLVHGFSSFILRNIYLDIIFDIN